MAPTKKDRLSCLPMAFKEAALERQLKDDTRYCSIQEQSLDAGRSHSFCASAKIIQIAEQLEKAVASFLILGFER